MRPEVIEMGKQTALITGASGGIGKELAKVFAENDFNLVLVARSETKLAALKKELVEKHGVRVTVILQDMTEGNATDKIVKQLGEANIQVDVLVNNAGFGDNAGFLDSNWEKQKQMVELNILALMRMTYVFGNQMRERGKGRILNLSSLAAFFSGPYMSVYYASKAFVLSFSEAVGAELKGTGVTVTALCPGPTTTGFESAAGLEGSKMFTFMKPQTAEAVARSGYKACIAGKPILYHGAATRLGSFSTRLVPRCLARNIAKKINGIPERKES